MDRASQSSGAHVDRDAGPRPAVAGQRQTPAASRGETTARRASPGQEWKRQRRQSTALIILAVIAVLFAIYAARAILLPVVIAVVLTLLLRPVVRRCRHFGIPDAWSAGVLLAMLLLLAASGLARLVGPAQEWVDQAPRHLKVVGEKLQFVREQVQEISRASRQVQALAEAEETTTDDAGQAAEVTQPLRNETLVDRTDAGEVEELAEEIKQEEPIAVEVRQPGLMTGLAFLTTTGEVLAGLVITVVLTYFLLATGDRLLNNVLHVMPTFRDKRKVVEMVYEVERGVSGYLLTVTLINIGLGVAIGVAMWLLGMPNAALWGAMATTLNFIPYLGAMIGTTIVFLVGVFTFDSVLYALLVPLVYFCLTALEGNLVTPALLGRKMSLSPVVVFLSLVFWGWMWGVGGALIAVPTLAILKVGFDQFDRTRALGTLIGG